MAHSRWPGFHPPAHSDPAALSPLAAKPTASAWGDGTLQMPARNPSHPGERFTGDTGRGSEYHNHVELTPGGTAQMQAGRGGRTAVVPTVPVVGLQTREPSSPHSSSSAVMQTLAPATLYPPCRHPQGPQSSPGQGQSRHQSCQWAAVGRAPTAQPAQGTLDPGKCLSLGITQEAQGHL